MKRRPMSWLLLAALLASLPWATAADRAPVTSVEDAIAMTRIQYGAAGRGYGGPVAAISPDGDKAVFVAWHGDLARDENVYTLMLLDLRRPLSPARRPVPILTRAFKGAPDEPLGSPISQLEFLGDNRTLVYLGRDDDGIAQAFSVDTQTGVVRQLTHHATTVRAFAVAGDGRLLAYSALSPDVEDAHARRLERDGVFLWDRDQFPMRLNHFAAYPALLKARMRTRQYFLAGAAQPFFDSAQSRPAKPGDLGDPKAANSFPLTLADESAITGWTTLKADPNGTRVLLYPFAIAGHDIHAERYAYYGKGSALDYKRRMAAPYGLVDATTGRVETLIDAPHPQYDPEGGDPLWAPDGKSVVIYTLLPDAPVAPPQWVEVDIATRAITPLGLPKAWQPIAWTDRGQALVLQGKDGHFGTLRHGADRKWRDFRDLGAGQGFDADWPVASDGHVVIGVKDASLVAPELAVHDLDSRAMTVVSNLNPQLRQRRYGAVETLHWQAAHDKDASGFLVKPVDYQPGRRYPLVVMLDDGTLRQEGEPFLLDGVVQLGSAAVQMLAAQGFMVLYAREPHMDDVLLTPEEGERMREHVEAAVAKLDHDGLIDPERVGITGWSRAGYYTDLLLMNASVAFAAAATMDGGGIEYNDGMRPFNDEELRRIRTPLLIEPHRLASLVQQSAMTDRLEAWGKPVEVLYFATATHVLEQPRQRLRSLGTHIDWWRFWLQGVEDDDPAKAGQYRQWESLCALQKKNNAGRPAHCPSPH